jgi:RNA polymerase sigma-70 factor (ECF subfamily)
VDTVTVSETSCDFNVLFETGYRRLARLVYKITGDTGSAEEIASEAFFRLHQNPPPSRTNIEGWLYRTGCRLALDHLKKARRRARYEAIAALFRLGASVNNSPDAELELADERRRVRRALGALKAGQIALILLRAEGFTYDELAAKLNLTPSSVGTLLTRAEEAFRKEYLKRYGSRRTR